MHVINGAVEVVPVEALTPHPANPRRANLDAIRESISENGFYGTLVAQRSSGHILAGHGRLAAAQAEGATTVPVIWLDVDDDRARRILLADNRTNDLAGYDEEQLAAVLQEIDRETASLAGTGYDADAVERLLARLPTNGADGEDDAGELVDRAEELRDRWQTERGQLWQVGRHRVMCGDATEAADVARLLDGETPALMVTDPPYGVDYDPDWRNDPAQAGARSMGPPGGRTVGTVSNDDRADWRKGWDLFPGDVCYVWHAALHTTDAQAFA